jgi:exosome complex RNA-binding protein Rrp42 (RNase PH superfamily)
VAYADAVCVEHDGSLLDATLLAVSAALASTRLPLTRVEADKEVVIVEARPYARALPMRCLPVSLTFGLLDEVCARAPPPPPPPPPPPR